MRVSAAVSELPLLVAATLACFNPPHSQMQDASSNASKNDWMLQGTSTSINNAVCCQFHHLAVLVMRNFSPHAEVYLMVTQITAVSASAFTSFSRCTFCTTSSSVFMFHTAVIQSVDFDSNSERHPGVDLLGNIWTHGRMSVGKYISQLYIYTCLDISNI